jgi:hypothetical protein
MFNEPARPAEWLAAVARFTGAYGGPPDFTDGEDVAAFLPLLAEAAGPTPHPEIADFINRATAQLRGDT